MFGAIKTNFALSSAAVVVQNLLEQWTQTGLFEFDPKLVSSKLVARVFAQDERQFNGKNGPKPHKISVAAIALAQGMRDYDSSTDLYAACRLSIGSILMEMAKNGDNYPLTGKDRAFLDLASHEYMKADLASDEIGIEPRPDIEKMSAENQPIDPNLQRRNDDLQARIQALSNRKLGSR